MKIWSFVAVAAIVFSGCTKGGGGRQPSAPSGPANPGGPSPGSSASPATSPGSSPSPSPSSSDAGGLQIFPADNAWNRDVSGDPVDPNSDTLLAGCGTGNLHPDFGTEWNGAPNGIPFVVVDKNQARVPVAFEYASESDPGPYPIPPDAPIEGGPNGTGDRHVLVLDKDAKKLYELFNAHPVDGGKSWRAGSGAVFDLTSNDLRPAGWTSADAAGLPIYPGLVRYDEAVERGEIKHALRFTCSHTRKAYVSPARHYASSDTDPARPPMGMRVRLKADVDIGVYPKPVQAILKAMKTYGMIVADNGSAWYVSGAPDPRWSDEELRTLKRVKSAWFEVVKMGPVVTD